MENKFSVWDNDPYRGNIPLGEKKVEHIGDVAEQVKQGNTSPFVTFLQVLSVLSILLGLVMFIGGLNSYHGEMLVLFGLVGGIFGSTFWWALSIIIKACQKYMREK